MDIPDPWPLRHLVIRTPRLEMRPDDDAGLLELVNEIHHGVHPPETMPFVYPWTDASREDIGGNTLRYFWGQRAACAPQRWDVNFLIRHDGQVIGSQGLDAAEFAVRREVHTGSWLGLRHQRRGFGLEMRAAVLMFAFEYLGAEQARSDAFTDNTASRAVSRKLGYVEEGTARHVRRGEPADVVRFLVTREGFEPHRPAWSIDVRGFDVCRPLLGLPAGT